MPQRKLIPENWRHLVCAALDSEDRARIIMTQRALNDWTSTFPSAFPFQLRVALSETLKDPSTEGVLKEMHGAQESYAFFFWYEKQRMYAKIGLMQDNTVVIIFSAHKPLKGEKL